MITFPANIPKHLSETFTKAQTHSSLPEILDEICLGVCALFKASSSILHYERINVSKDLIVEEHFSHTGAMLEEMDETLPDTWRESGIHDAARHDLLTRLSAISHSSYSWPYPSVTIEGSSQPTFPAGYTILVPFSSNLIVRRDSEANFFGYQALFFDSFPDLDEEIIGLIISLPSFLSEFVSALLRHFEASTVSGNVLSHDFKQYVLLQRQLTYRAQDSLKNEKGDVGEILRRMDASSSRMLTLTSQFLLADRDYAGTLRFKQISVDLNALIQEVLAEVEPRFELGEVALKAEYDAELPEIPLDPAIFPSVIHNLLDNALKYSRKHGTVEIFTRKVDESHVAIQIADDGIGIPESDSENIFKKHFRAENTKGKGGNGLGLYLVRRIVESHGGNIKLVDDAESKTVFEITLPVEPQREVPFSEEEVI